MNESTRVLAALSLLLGSCAVGPDYQRPAAPRTERYHAPEPAAAAATASQAATQPQLAVGADLPGQWWQLFKCPPLDAALKLAIANNYTLAAANATLAQAREAVTVARAGLLPHLGGTAGAQRSGTSEAGVPQASQSLYTLGLSASYSVDVFGGTRRLVEQQQALAQLQRYQLAAAYLTLTGSVVSEAMTIASTRLQITTTQDLIASDRKNLALTQREFEVGTAARSDVLTADSQLAADLTTLPSLMQQLAAARDALAILVGQTPADWAAHDFDIDEFTVPRELPVSLPSALVRQRPDILASEAQLHAASAAIGIAVAQEYPSVTLSAGLSREALSAADLFHEFNTLRNAGGALAAPLYEGGALRAQVRAERDAFNAQAASYEQTVLEGLGQVADDLWALKNDTDRLGVFRHSLDIASEALKLQQASYGAGKSDVLDLINAQRTYAQARLGLVTAEITQYEDVAGLLVALGGGWWHDGIAAQ